MAATTLPPPLPAEPGDARWQRRAEQQYLAQLPSIQASAEKWGATLATLTGLFSAAILVKGPSELEKLSDPARWLVIGAAVIGVLCAALATGLAALAAQGTPVKAIPNATVTREVDRREADQAATYLKWSRWLAIPAVLGILSSILLTWVLTPAVDKAGASGDTMVVVRRDGTVMCGELRTDAAGNVGLAVGKDKKQLVPVGPVQSITPASSCPQV